MKSNYLLPVLTLFCLLTAFTVMDVFSWKLQDEDYIIKFENAKAKGTINGLKGDIVFDKNNLPASNFKVSVDANTLKLGLFMKTSHAKSKDFFNVEKYPSITFQSKKVQKKEDGFKTKGILTIKNKSKKVEIDFTFVEEETKGVFEGSFEIQLEDFDLANKGLKGPVKIDMRIPVIR